MSERMRKVNKAVRHVLADGIEGLADPGLGFVADPLAEQRRRRRYGKDCFSMKAVTKRGIVAVRSQIPRTRWIARSSGAACPASVRAIRVRSRSPGMSTSKS